MAKEAVAMVTVARAVAVARTVRATRVASRAAAARVVAVRAAAVRAAVQVEASAAVANREGGAHRGSLYCSARPRHECQEVAEIQVSLPTCAALAQGQSNGSG